MSAPEILPLCTTRETRGRVYNAALGCWMIPTYCMNCGIPYGYRNDAPPAAGYVGVICEPCAESWQPLLGVALVPDQVHAQRANDAMLEAYGRVLSQAEQVIALDDVNSVLSRFARSLPSP